MTEVTQAAQRLRRYWNDPTDLMDDYCIDERTADYRTLAKAWLAEHADDDDELITEAWIDEIWDDTSATMEYRTSNGKFEVGSINGCEFLNWKHITTRGQLRLLLRALS